MMTSNDPTGDPGSDTNLQTVQADEQIEADVDMEKSEDADQPSERLEESQFHAQQLEHRAVSDQPRDELTRGSADPSLAEKEDKVEEDVGRPRMEEVETKVQEQGFEHRDGVANTQTKASNEEMGKQPVPASSKEAVQDPGVVDIDPITADNGVIDVDTFDDDVSVDDDAAPSPAGDETMEELESANEPSLGETQRLVTNDLEGEAIDLTASPPAKPKKGRMLPENDETMADEDRSALDRHEALHDEDVIDVDEPEEKEDGSTAIEAEGRQFGEDVESPPVEEDENHGKSNTDTETASAELNPELDGEDVSSGEAPVDSNAIEATAEGEMGTSPSQERSSAAEHSDEDAPTAVERGNGLEIDEVEAEGGEDTGENDGGVDVTGPGSGKPETDNSEGHIAQDESEDDEVEDDGASGRNDAEPEETEAEGDESPSTLAERAEVKNEVDDKTASADQHEIEGGRGQGSSPQGISGHPMSGVSGKEAASQAKQPTETANANNGDVLAMHTATGDSIFSATVDGAHQQIEGKKGADSDASAVGVHSVQGMTGVSTGAPKDDESYAACAGVTPDPGSLEMKDLNEVRPSTPSSDHRDDSTRDSGKDVVMGSAEREKEASTAPPSTVPAEAEAKVHPSTQQGQGSSEGQEEVDRKAEEAAVNLSSSFGASEEVKHTPALGEKSSVEDSKKTSAGHLAPMFGIQLSRPIKSGPVTFSSPTSFPRYSLNPQAAPFLPAKLRRTESTERSTDSSKSPARVSTPPNETKVIESESQQETIQTHDQSKALDVDYLADKSVETEPISSSKENESITDAKPEPSSGKARLPVTPIEADKDLSKDGSAQPAPKVILASTPKPPLKRPAPKKVSFAPTAIEIGGRLVEPEKGHVAGAGPTAVVQKGGTTEKFPARGTHRDSKAESENHSKAGRQVLESDDVKDKQTILQVQTDEGLRREVTNVTVAMRQGNSKVRPERKKFTVRLTTGTDGKAKLQFFKTTGPSLKLYASLDSSRDNLRVRKVTNRQYVMSVAKVAPPDDDAANIIVKYFLHFDERDTFEEMYSQCVANLQRQPKPAARTKETDENSKSLKNAAEETKDDSNNLSSKSAGIKRAAETVNGTQISKRSKLLADKKKLLDKMAALRRKKEQKGLSAKKEGQTQPVTEAPSSGSSRYRATDKSAAHSGALKRKGATKPELDLKHVVEAVPAPKESTQLLRKRNAEELSNENASKKARGSSLHSAGNAVGAVRGPQLDGRSKLENISLASMSEAVEEDLKAHGADVGKSPSTDGVNLSQFHSDASQQQSGEGSREKGVPSTNALAEQKSKEVEALTKVTRDFKRSEEEKNALQLELDSRNRLLEAEREKASRIQRENSDAWQRIVKTVETLGADMSRLRREDTDRSLESLTRCEACSSEDFFDRLHSFRPSTWAAFENSEIGALECALRGWHNCGPGKIRSSEGSEITLHESFDDANFRHGEVERVRSLLREGHCLLSGWIGRACPDSFRTLEGSQRMMTKEQLRANVGGLRRGLDGSEMKFEWGASALLLSDDSCEKLAVYNWSMDGECLRCAWCNRRVVVDLENRFEAQSKHYAFCPFRAEDWKASVLRNAATLGIEGDSDAAMQG